MTRGLRVLSILLLTGIGGSTFAQDIWSKVPNYPDTVFMGLFHGIAIGDSIFISGEPNYTHVFSPDAGATWQSANIVDGPSNTYIQELPINDMVVYTTANNVYIMGPNVTWTNYMQDAGTFAELGLNNLLFYSQSWELLFTGPADGTNFVSTGIDFDFHTSIRVGNRLILGGSDGRFATIDNGDMGTFTISTTNPAPAPIDKVNQIVRQPDGDLFARLGGFPHRLSKSTDNGSTWNIVPTTYSPADQYAAISSIALTTAGDILITSESDTRVWKSTNDGVSAVPFTTGIPAATVFQVSMTHLMRTRNGNNFVGVRFFDPNGPPYLIAENSGLFETGSATSVMDLRNDLVLSAYPVPCRDRLTLELPQERAAVELIDALGKVVLSTSTFGGTTTLDLAGAVAGYYTVMVRSNGTVRAAQVIVE